MRDKFVDRPRGASRHASIEPRLASEPGELASRKLDRGEVFVERERRAHFVASSIAASTSAGGTHEPASTLALICSGEVAPAMTDRRPARGEASHREMEHRHSCFGRDLLERLDLVEVAVVQERHRPRRHRAARAEPRAFGTVGSPLVLAREQPARQREERQHPDAEAAARGDDVVLDPPVDQGVLVLRRHHAGPAIRARGPVGVRDLPSGEVRAADVAHLPRGHEVVERAQGLVDRRCGSGRCI